MISDWTAPYFVFGAAFFAMGAGIMMMIYPWWWRWRWYEAAPTSLLSLLIVILSSATVLEVALYMNWLN